MVTTAASTNTRSKRKPIPRPPSGPAMKDMLKRHAGITAPQVVRSRTGNYVANIFVPGLHTSIEPANVWTDKMLKAFSGIKIVEVGETRAEWRKGEPVVMVGITFTGDDIKPKPQAQPISVYAAPCRFYSETSEPCRI
jgi:hypothetical protein